MLSYGALDQIMDKISDYVCKQSKEGLREDFQPLHVKRAFENGRRNRVRHLRSPFRRVNCTFVGVRQSPSPHG